MVASVTRLSNNATAVAVVPSFHPVGIAVLVRIRPSNGKTAIATWPPTSPLNPINPKPKLIRSKHPNVRADKYSECLAKNPVPLQGGVFAFDIRLSMDCIKRAYPDLPVVYRSPPVPSRPEYLPMAEMKVQCVYFDP